jgi:hypothetical protein
MIKYPVRAPSHNYGGRDEHKREDAYYWNMVATKVADHINRDLEMLKQGSRTYHNHEIARSINEDSIIVGEVTSRMDGGGNGITASIDPSNRFSGF